MATTDCTDYAGAVFNNDAISATTTAGSSLTMLPQTATAVQQQQAYTAMGTGTTAGSMIYSNGTSWNTLVWDEEAKPQQPTHSKPGSLDDIIGQEVRRLRG